MFRLACRTDFVLVKESPFPVVRTRSESFPPAVKSPRSQAASPEKPQNAPRVENQSPTRRPATPLRGIGKFLQHRRRGASPDSPSVRSDLLSGSVVAGLVATAIQEVESSAPDPTKNKPMADLVERAVRAEFKLGQLELQKKQLWQLIAIEEEQTQKERAKQRKFVWFVLAMLGMELILFGAVTLQGNMETVRWVGSLVAIHVSMAFTAAYVFEQLCFARRGNDDGDCETDEEREDGEEAEEDVGNEVDPTGRNETPGAGSNQPQMTPDLRAAERKQIALDEMKETIALLPQDQKGLEWITQSGDQLLVRFLRAYDFRVGKAFKYFVKCAEWRYDSNIDTLVDVWGVQTKTRSAQLLKDTWPVFDLGTTHNGQGDRIILFRLAMCDFPGYYRACASEDVTHHTLYEFERVRQSSKRHVILIVDLGFSDDDVNRPINSVGQLRTWIAASMQYLGTMTKLIDPYFPDMFSKIIFVRTPATFWATWRVAQLLIPERTRDKITVLTADAAIERLSAMLHGEELCIPEYLGGKFAANFASKGGLIIRNPTTAHLARS